MFDNASAELLWFLVGLILLLSELALPGFVIVFFGVGAWVTAVLVGFGEPLEREQRGHLRRGDDLGAVIPHHARHMVREEGRQLGLHLH
mgnify:CR=1 FL=1